MRRLLLLVLAAAALVSGPAQSAATLTREQADAIALRLLQPKAYPDAVLYRLPGPLEVVGGQSVPIEEAGPLEGITTDELQREVLNSVRVKSGTRFWFYWLDIAHGAEFEKPSKLLLLDAASGAVVAERTFYWEPLIAGKPPAFLESQDAERDPKYVVASSVPLLRPPPPSPPTGTSQLPRGFMANDCLVTIGDLWQEEDFRSDLADFTQWGAHVGMRSFAMPANSTGTDLVQRVHELASATAPCHNILIVLAGHGSPPPGYTDPHAAPSKEATVRTGFGVHAVSGGYEESDYHVRAFDFQQLLAQNPRTTFELVVDSCFGGRFGELKTWANAHQLTNLLLVASSAKPTETTVGHIEAGVVSSAAHQQPNGWFARYVAAPLTGLTVVDNPERPRQSPPESDYTHAFIDSLYRWSDTKPLGYQQPPEPFLSELSLAAYAGQQNFVASDLHWTTPGRWGGDRSVDYRYDVKITVSDATLSWSNPDAPQLGYPVSGTGTASWELDFDNAVITVDQWARTIGAKFGTLNTVGGPETDAPTGGTVHAGGTQTIELANGPVSCGYALSGAVADLKQQGWVFGLQSIAGDEFQTQPSDGAGFQWTGALVLEPVVVDGPLQSCGLFAWNPPDYGLAGLGYINPNGGTTPLTGPGGGCAAIQPLIAVPVWRLGDPKPITLEGKLVGSACSGLKMTAGGTYKVVLTPR